MPKPNHEWKVQPHGPVQQLDDGLWAVVGEVAMPLVDLPRRMTIVRLTGRRLLIWSAIAVDEDAIAAIEAQGVPAFMVVPSDHHRLDAAAWKARYPELVVATPAGAAEKTGEVVAVDTTSPDFDDPDIRFLPVAGTRNEEAALVVRRAGGTTLVLNDIVANIRHASGFGGWLLRRMGLAGDQAQVPSAVAMMIVKDKEALAAQLNAWAELGDLRRIVVSHGDVIEADPSGVLRELARSLT